MKVPKNCKALSKRQILTSFSFQTFCAIADFWWNSVMRLSQSSWRMEHKCMEQLQASMSQWIHIWRRSRWQSRIEIQSSWIHSVFGEIISGITSCPIPCRWRRCWSMTRQNQSWRNGIRKEDAAVAVDNEVDLLREEEGLWMDFYKL